MAQTLHLPFTGERLRLPRLGRRRKVGLIAGEIAAGAATLVALGLGAYLLRRRSTPEASHMTLESTGPFSLRRYRPMTVARVRRDGLMTEALDAGFRPLADYIHGKPDARKQDGATKRKIAMTTPVIAAPADASGSWDIRFVMPGDQRPTDLPAPAGDVALEQVPERKVAAIRFTGKGTDRALVADKQRDLMNWVTSRGLTAVSQPEFAAYDPPFVPGALRRNEWWVEVEGPRRK